MIRSLHPNHISTSTIDIPINNNTHDVFVYRIRCLSSPKLEEQPIAYAVIGLNNGTYFLDHLFVQHKHRNKGIGQQLLNVCLNNYGENIELMVNVNNHVAIYIYQKFGFITVRRKNNYQVMKCSRSNFYLPSANE